MVVQVWIEAEFCGENLGLRCEGDLFWRETLILSLYTEVPDRLYMHIVESGRYVNVGA